MLVWKKISQSVVALGLGFLINSTAANASKSVEDFLALGELTGPLTVHGKPDLMVSVSQSSNSIIVAYSELGCGGELKVRDVFLDKTTYNEQLTFGIKNCQQGGIVHLVPQPDGTLLFEWYPSEFAIPTAFGAIGHVVAEKPAIEQSPALPQDQLVQLCFENIQYELQCNFDGVTDAQKVFALRSITTHTNPFVTNAAWAQLVPFFQTSDQIQLNPALAVEVLANAALTSGKFDALNQAYEIIAEYGVPAPVFNEFNSAVNFESLGTQYVRTIYEQKGREYAINLGVALVDWAARSEQIGETYPFQSITNLAFDGDADLAYYFFQTAETERDRQEWQYYAAKHGHLFALFELGSRLVDEDPILNPFWTEGMDRKSAMSLSVESGGEMLKRASEGGVEGATEKYSAFQAKVIEDQRQRDEELARIAAKEGRRKEARRKAIEASRVRRAASTATLDQKTTSAMLGQSGHTSETRSFTQKIINGDAVELNPRSTAFFGGVSAALIGRCSVPNKSELARLTTAGASNMMFGADYTNPDIGRAISSMVEVNTLMVLGQKVGKNVPCGEMANAVAQNIARISSRARTENDAFMSSCPFSQSQCGCLAQIGSGVMPDIYARRYERSLIPSIINKNPLLGLQIPMACGIQSY